MFVSSNLVKPSVFPTCSIPQPHFYPLNNISLCFKDVDCTHLYLEKQLPTIFVEERDLIPLVRYQMYYNYAKTKILQKIPIEQKNIENQNTKNDTFIDRNPSSLSSSMGQPPTE
jgi:hypothetical protein